MFFAESSIGGNGSQGWGEATWGNSEEDIQTRAAQVQTAVWLEWGLGDLYKEVAILPNSGKFKMCLMRGGSRAT